jgi:hypothetical protein
MATIATVWAVICLAACGGSSPSSGHPGLTGSVSPPTGAPSAQALVNDALTALKSAQSVRISGSVTQSGKNLRLNVGFVKSGAFSGTMSGPFAGTQATFTLIATGGKTYLLLDKAFFNALSKTQGIPASACQTLCGKYVAVPAAQFGNFSLNGLTSSMLKGAHKAAPGVVVTSVNGQPAYRVSDGHGSFLYIAENGTHYPLEITKPGTGTLTFTDWNSVPPITAPPASQVISLPGGIG